MQTRQKKRAVPAATDTTQVQKCNSYCTYILQQIQNDCKGGF